jgi:uncharacterized protein YhbP (UPF0306 family)
MLKQIAGRNVRGELVCISASEERVLTCVHRILDDSVLCSMSTVTRDHRAHINIAYVAYTNDLRLCFMSHPTALHCQNIRLNASMAISVFRSAQDWSGPDRGLQLFGSCHIATKHESTEAAQVYGRRFVQYDDWMRSLPEGAPGREYQWCWFFAEEFKLIDETEFGDGVVVSATVQR